MIYSQSDIFSHEKPKLSVVAETSGRSYIAFWFSALSLKTGNRGKIALWYIHIQWLAENKTSFTNSNEIVVKHFTWSFLELEPSISLMLGSQRILFNANLLLFVKVIPKSYFFWFHCMQATSFPKRLINYCNTSNFKFL